MSEPSPYAQTLATQFGLDLADPVVRLVAKLLADVTDRRRWGQEWDQFDADVQREIVEQWRTIVREEVGP